MMVARSRNLHVSEEMLPTTPPVASVGGRLREQAWLCNGPSPLKGMNDVA